MLQLTMRTEYGLIALVHMADLGPGRGARSGRESDSERASHVVSVREISERYPIPRRLLAEVLKDLSRAGLVESQRGATGGYALTRSPDAITLAEIVGALEGSPALTSCEGHDAAHDMCGVVPVCPIRSPLSRIRAGIWELMERTTLRSLLRSSEPIPLHLHSNHLHSNSGGEPSLAGTRVPPESRS
jgi:Rrf2 family protein